MKIRTKTSATLSNIGSRARGSKPLADADALDHKTALDSYRKKDRISEKVNISSNSNKQTQFQHLLSAIALLSVALIKGLTNNQYILLRRQKM